MTARQKVTLALFLVGFTLSASPLLLLLGTHDLTAAFDCLTRDLTADACVKYGDDPVRVLYGTFVASGQQYLFLTVPIGMVMILVGIILTFIDERRNTTACKGK